MKDRRQVATVLATLSLGTLLLGGSVAGTPVLSPRPVGSGATQGSIPREPTPYARPTATPSTEGSIPVGNQPDAIAFDPDSNDVFVANSGTSNVTVISASTNRVLTSIQVGGMPEGIAVDPENGRVFVSTGFTDEVSVISDSTLEVTGTVTVGDIPDGLCYDPVNGDVYVANAELYSYKVSVLDPTSDAVIDSVDVGQAPTSVACDPDSGDVFVANSQANNISVISGATQHVIATVPDYSAWSVGFDNASNTVDVANYGTNSLSVLSASSFQIIATVPTGRGPQASVFDPNNGYLYVAIGGGIGCPVCDPPGNTTSVFEATNLSLVTTLHVGLLPNALALDPTTNDLYVTNQFSDNVRVISLPFVSTTSGGSPPSDLTRWGVLLAASISGALLAAAFYELEHRRRKA